MLENQSPGYYGMSPFGSNNGGAFSSMPAPQAVQSQWLNVMQQMARQQAVQAQQNYQRNPVNGYSPMMQAQQQQLFWGGQTPATVSSMRFPAGKSPNDSLFGSLGSPLMSMGGGGGGGGGGAPGAMPMGAGPTGWGNPGTNGAPGNLGGPNPNSFPNSTGTAANTQGGPGGQPMSPYAPSGWQNYDPANFGMRGASGPGGVAAQDQAFSQGGSSGGRYAQGMPGPESNQPSPFSALNPWNGRDVNGNSTDGTAGAAGTAGSAAPGAMGPSALILASMAGQQQQGFGQAANDSFNGDLPPSPYVPNPYGLADGYQAGQTLGQAYGNNVWGGTANYGGTDDGGL